MQGIYSSTFKGKKKDIERLLEFFKREAKAGDKTFIGVLQDIKLPSNYSNAGDNDEMLVSVGMESSGNINWFDHFTFYSDCAKEVPELEMHGTFNYLDIGGVTKYSSSAGSDSIEEDETLEQDYISCEFELTGKGANRNVRKRLEEIIDSEENEIIRYTYIHALEHGKIFCEICDTENCKNEDDYENLEENIRDFFDKLAVEFPNLRLKGHACLDDSHSYSGREFEMFVLSEEGEDTCCFAEDEEGLDEYEEEDSFEDEDYCDED